MPIPSSTPGARSFTPAARRSTPLQRRSGAPDHAGPLAGITAFLPVWDGLGLLARGGSERLIKLDWVVPGAAAGHPAAIDLGPHVAAWAAPLAAWLAWWREAAETAGQARCAPRKPALEPVGGFFGNVLEQMQKIPLGETRTYGDLAAAMGRPRAARAVARGCAANPYPLLVPCHRVVRADGGLGGYSGRGGIRTKRRLLRAEGAWPPTKPGPSASAPPRR